MKFELEKFSIFLFDEFFVSLKKAELLLLILSIELELVNEFNVENFKFLFFENKFDFSDFPFLLEFEFKFSFSSKFIFLVSVSIISFLNNFLSKGLLLLLLFFWIRKYFFNKFI